jgi:CBS domain-containing protein
VASSGPSPEIRKRRVRKGMGTIVEDLMTPDPITIRPDDTLETAVELMDATGSSGWSSPRRICAFAASSRAPT